LRPLVVIIAWHCMLCAPAKTLVILDAGLKGSAPQGSILHQPADTKPIIHVKRYPNTDLSVN